MNLEFIKNIIRLSHENILHEILVALTVFLFFLVLRKFFTNVVFAFLKKITGKTKFLLDEYILDCIEKPVRFLFVVFGLYASMSLIVDQVNNQLLVDKAFRSLIVYTIAWGLYNISNSSSELFNKIFEKYKLDNDKILFPFISKVFRIVIVLLAISIIVQEWGYNVEGFIAGLGLGGLAFALAAQDTISNVFGGIVIITEKPFTLGDWIETPSVEGTVEDISFRSTRVRTFAQALVTIPNSTIAKESVTNWSRMGRRRITFNLGVMYSTPSEKIQKSINRIKELLHGDEEIHQKTIFVNFDKFNESSLDIFIYFFTKTTIWGEYLRVKEKINFEIMRILEEEGVQVALPSTSIYFENKMISRSENGELKEEN